MPLPSKAFQQWLKGIAPDATLAEVCRISGVKRTTIAQQMVRGKVAESKVVRISRAFHVDPLAALSSFEAYADLAGPIPPPSDAELLSQVATLDLLRAVIQRTSLEGTVQLELAEPPHATSVKNWVESIDDGDLRQRVCEATGIAPQNFSAHLTANRMPPELAVATSRTAGVGPTGGLVASGLISPAEAGWPPEARGGALERLSDGDLASLAGDRLLALGKALRRHEHDHERTERIWENLG
jgi:hypothetical protein